MRICVTGARGYVGSVLVPLLEHSGHTVSALDIDYFASCVLPLHGTGSAADPPTREVVRADVRDVLPLDFEGCDAVIHLAAVSNDPMGELHPQLTHEINVLGTRRVLQSAREAGVSRFVFASSCSVYGDGNGAAELDETSEPRPLTVYAQSKAESEVDVIAAADGEFRTTVLRGPSMFGLSPRLRLDLVVNELTAMAASEGVVTVRSSGIAWRPLLHVEDFAAAFMQVVEADPARLTHDRYNVGSSQETYRIIDVARAVCEITGAQLRISDSPEPDARNYRVCFRRLHTDLPEFVPQWTLPRGVAQMMRAFRKGTDSPELGGGEFRRLPWLQSLLAAGDLAPDLRWTRVDRLDARLDEPRGALG